MGLKDASINCPISGGARSAPFTPQERGKRRDSAVQTRAGRSSFQAMHDIGILNALLADRTTIIYRIAVNYILGFEDRLKEINHNFIQKDAVRYAKAGKLAELVDKEFGSRQAHIKKAPIAWSLFYCIL